MSTSEKGPKETINKPPLEAHPYRPWIPDLPEHFRNRNKRGRLRPETMRNIQARTKAIQEEILGTSTPNVEQEINKAPED
jgi:hypothetical protein